MLFIIAGCQSALDSASLLGENQSIWVILNSNMNNVKKFMNYCCAQKREKVAEFTIFVECHINCLNICIIFIVYFFVADGELSFCPCRSLPRLELQ